MNNFKSRGLTRKKTSHIKSRFRTGKETINNPYGHSAPRWYSANSKLRKKRSFNLIGFSEEQTRIIDEQRQHEKALNEFVDRLSILSPVGIAQMMNEWHEDSRPNEEHDLFKWGKDITREIVCWLAFKTVVGPFAISFSDFKLSCRLESSDYVRRIEQLHSATPISTEEAANLFVDPKILDQLSEERMAIDQEISYAADRLLMAIGFLDENGEVARQTASLKKPKPPQQLW